MDASNNKGIFHANGADIYFEAQGEGENLLFIHAGITDRRMWDREFKNMSNYYRTIRMDLPGYGLSDFTGGEYSYNEILKELLHYLKAENTYIVAASFGGKIALDFVLSNQDICQGIVLMAPAVSGWHDSQFLLAYYDEEDKLLQSKDFEKIAALNFNTWILRDRPVDAVRQDIKDLVVDMQMKALMKEEPDTKSIEIEEEDNVLKLRNIKIPILIVIGDHDVEDFQNIANLIHKEINSSKKIIMENASHLANLEYPEVFESIVLEFFSSLTAPHLA
ncbi:alpha/beta fold hydrolase [Paenibacillus sanguinis]|uniref:alpha/beta fold hydrolase n=1 Tax=Paenibacillus sanguinis TaxID=225906 RepID=UPI00036F616B|nr:alpha/beta hydrolase [Paenibacillus sanguinis]